MTPKVEAAEHLLHVSEAFQIAVFALEQPIQRNFFGQEQWAHSRLSGVVTVLAEAAGENAGNLQRLPQLEEDSVTKSTEEVQARTEDDCFPQQLSIYYY